MRREGLKKRNDWPLYNDASPLLSRNNDLHETSTLSFSTGKSRYFFKKKIYCIYRYLFYSIRLAEQFHFCFQYTYFQREKWSLALTKVNNNQPPSNFKFLKSLQTEQKLICENVFAAVIFASQ